MTNKKMSYQVLQRATLLLYLPQGVLERSRSFGRGLDESPTRLGRPGLATRLAGRGSVVGVGRGRRWLDGGGLRDGNASQDWGGCKVAIVKRDVGTVEEL